MKRLLLAVALTAACSASSEGAPEVDASASRLGGDTTVFDGTASAFSFSARNLSDANHEAYLLGASFFRRAWVTAPATIAGNDGLGPTYNALACTTCHVKAGRGAPPLESAPDAPFVGLLLRLSAPGVGLHGAPLDEPTYGAQLNTLSILGVPREGVPHVTYTELPGRYADGTPFSLRAPTYTVSDLAFGPMVYGTMISPRVAPTMVGLGLLEAVPEATILASADPDDRDGDGVSGRANEVWDATLGRTALGRFGWKANEPSVRQQTAAAFLGDIGLTSPLFPFNNCPSPQLACRNAPSGGTPEAPEVSDDKLVAAVAYASAVAVPARRDLASPVTQRGEALFTQARCTTCHTPKLETGDLAGYPELSRQTIRPFTDLLLHDMGDPLGDGRPDFQASGNEWRTPPLWGIGLVSVVNKHTYFLHDGRARGLAEAILWHGGEGAKARDAFLAMPKADRDALVAFLESL